MSNDTKSSSSVILTIFLVILFGLLLIALLLPVTGGDSSPAWHQSRNNLKTLALAIHAYHDANGCFPIAVVYGPDGETPHSWRVAILPLIGERDLYDEYRFDEPWDSQHNKTLIAKMPAVFRNPKDTRSTGNTCCFAIVGEGTLFPSNGRQIQLEDIVDGPGSTILLVEAIRNVPWTKPEDIPYDATKPLPELGGFHAYLMNIAMADASVSAIKNDIDEEILRNLITITIAEGNEIPADW